MKVRLSWQAEISGVQSRNNFVQFGGEIIFSSAGRTWNKSDEKDGVYSIDSETGRVNWFVPSGIDVNEIALVNGVVIAPTDRGEVLLIDASTSNVINSHRLGGPAFGKAIPFTIGGRRIALIASSNGGIFSIDVKTGNLELVANLDCSIRASLLFHKRKILAFSQEGGIFSLEPDNDWSVTKICDAPVGHYGGPSGIAVAPLKIGDRLYIGYARETYYDDPPLFCYDLKKGEIVWEGRGAPQRHYGNLRSSPAMVRGKLVIAPAYSDSLVLVSPRTGAVISEIKVGQSVFQQWSGPVPLSNRYVAIGRVDGVCSIVDVETGRLSASISLVTAENERFFQEPDQSSDETYRLYPGEPAPAGGIVGTPFNTGSALFVGTTDGQIARVELAWIE